MSLPSRGDPVSSALAKPPRWRAVHGHLCNWGIQFTNIRTTWPERHRPKRSSHIKVISAKTHNRRDNTLLLDTRRRATLVLGQMRRVIFSFSLPSRRVATILPIARSPETNQAARFGPVRRYCLNTSPRARSALRTDWVLREDRLRRLLSLVSRLAHGHMYRLGRWRKTDNRSVPHLRSVDWFGAPYSNNLPSL